MNGLERKVQTTLIDNSLAMSIAKRLSHARSLYGILQQRKSINKSLDHVRSRMDNGPSLPYQGAVRHVSLLKYGKVRYRVIGFPYHHVI